MKMNYFPTVAGFYSHTEKILKSGFDMAPKNLAGVNVSIPIFSSGMRKAKISQAKIRLENGKNNKELLKKHLMIQEKQNRFNLKNAMEQYESHKNNLEVSKRVQENINQKYQQEIVSSLDLTTSNNNYLKAEANYIGAVLQLLEADIALKKLLNKL